jgi:hypothetical protein
MSRKLRVYGWTGHRNESRGPRNHHGQTREIVAAHSAAEVMRITGMTRTEWTHSGCETGNDREIAIALASPGIVFWTPLNARDEKWTEAP